MITRQISTDDFLRAKEYYGDQSRVMVVTLDGEPVTDAFAGVKYDLDDLSGYHLFYQKQGVYYETFVVLRGPNGQLVEEYGRDDFDFELQYAAERPGKYPDTAATYEQFVGARQQIDRKKDRGIIPDRVWQHVKWADDGDQESEELKVYRYPGNFWLIDDGIDHGDQFRGIDLDFFSYDGEVTSWELKFVEEYLFEMFLLYGRHF